MREGARREQNPARTARGAEGGEAPWGDGVGDADGKPPENRDEKGRRRTRERKPRRAASLRARAPWLSCLRGAPRPFFVMRFSFGFALPRPLPRRAPAPAPRRPPAKRAASFAQPPHSIPEEENNAFSSRLSIPEAILRKKRRRAKHKAARDVGVLPQTAEPRAPPDRSPGCMGDLSGKRGGEGDQGERATSLHGLSARGRVGVAHHAVSSPSQDGNRARQNRFLCVRLPGGPPSPLQGAVPLIRATPDTFPRHRWTRADRDQGGGCSDLSSSSRSCAARASLRARKKRHTFPGP
jgi:hypothetical protein